ncbi:YdeI/OmpD-associated family protein [uncultured Aquimarina sp.]|uniref:YdeI/OmpD-associated family protein n=1 Tax=uncultured Aquimarina sp. TaxID=575652 RepID=UPI00260882D9|nr:YdeI/OmpD-associated family protein [uncultured Aquimarina sp.]
MQYNTSVEEFISKKPEWVKSLQLLRSIMLTTEMEETIKWGVPTYTINGKNIVGISAFKSYVGIWFHQGVFLKDPFNQLINAQEGKTKGLRQWRFSSFDEINKDQVLAYVLEAIQNQKEGKEITIERSSTEIEMPDRLKTELEQNKELKLNFDKLTPFKQKEYMEYISTAKRDATKDARLQKIIPMILKGIGLNDKYR